MKHSSYAEYKDSGFKWLDKIPKHWNSSTLKHLFLNLDRKRIPLSSEQRSYILDKKYPYYGASGIIDYVDKYLFSESLILVAEDGANLLSRSTPLAFVAKGKYWVNNHAHILKPRTGCISYWEGILQSYDYTPHVSGAAQPKLTSENLGSIHLPIPPHSEQTIIANFLDRETAKIDDLISKQQRLIELLQEKRQAVISHAVTKGLNPDVPMKDSGVEWLGEIPAHWQIERIATFYSERVESGREDLPILSVSIHHGISDKELSTDELDKKVTHIEDKTKYKRVYPNDIAYNMMRAWQGGFGAVLVDGIISPAYVVARPKRQDSIDSRYMEKVFRTKNCIEEMRRYSKGITDFRSRLYWEHFKNIRIPIPPPSEQTQLLKMIADTEEKTQLLISKAQLAISLLNERRTALISAAVTGKIDVRNA